MSENKKPLFSVIVPLHNASGYMRIGLDSIREQVFTDYELILVCDSCNDNTAEIAREYSDIVIETDYANDGMARDAGLDAATGEWILFMDDDDHWLHEYVFDILSRVVGKNNEDILMFSFIWKHVGYAKNEPGNYWIAVWNKCWRRSFIGNTRFPNIKYFSDKYFNREMMSKNPRVSIWDMPLYYYNFMREGSLSYEQDQNGKLWQEEGDNNVGNSSDS